MSCDEISFRINLTSLYPFLNKKYWLIQEDLPAKIVHRLPIRDIICIMVVTRMDTPKSDIRSETGTEWHYFSANRSDSLRPCCVQRDKYKKAEKGQDENGYSKIWIKAYIEVSCFSRSFCKNLVQGANNVCLITVPRLPCKAYS